MIIFQHTLALTRVNGLSTFFFIAVVVMYWEANAHPLTEAYISLTQFFLRVIYNKPYCR